MHQAQDEDPTPAQWACYCNAQDVLLHYGATKYGSGPIALGERSPRQSYNPAAPDFLRERGSYQNPLEHP